MAVVVDLPDWREQFSMILGALDVRRSACQGSGRNDRAYRAKVIGSFLQRSSIFSLAVFAAFCFTDDIKIGSELCIYISFRCRNCYGLFRRIRLEQFQDLSSRIQTRANRSILPPFACFPSWSEGLIVDLLSALQDSEAIIISKENSELLRASVPGYISMILNYLNMIYIHNFEEHSSIILDSAEVRYQNFIKARPELTQLVPLYMIASYLGITKEALSRIRHKMASQKV